MPRFARGQIVTIKGTDTKAEILSYDKRRNEYLIHVLSAPQLPYPVYPLKESKLVESK